MSEANAVDALIDVRGLRKSYASPAGEVEVLHGLDFSIRSGEFVAVMGPSGSGKSTMMNILGCLDTPSAGRYTLAGHATESLDSDALAKLRNDVIGFVFQGFNLLNRTSLEDNVALPLVYRGLSKPERRAAARGMLAKVGLEAYAASRPNQISGGQQQRVAIARALVGKPRIVFADEPTGNLDTANSDAVMAMLLDMKRRGVAIVMVTHAPELAAQADRQIFMRDGRVVEVRTQTP